MVCVKEILEKAKSVGIAKTVLYLTDLPDCQNPNPKSLRTAITCLQSEENRHRKNGKGKESLEKFLMQPFPFPAKNDSERSLVLKLRIMVKYLI